MKFLLPQKEPFLDSKEINLEGRVMITFAQLFNGFILPTFKKIMFITIFIFQFKVNNSNQIFSSDFNYNSQFSHLT